MRAPSEAGASIAGSASALPSHLRPVGEAVDGSPRYRIRDPSPRRVPSNPMPSEHDAENLDMNINGNGVGNGSHRQIFEGVASAKALPPRSMFNKQGSSSSAFAVPPEKQNTPASAMHSMVMRSPLPPLSFTLPPFPDVFPMLLHVMNSYFHIVIRRVDSGAGQVHLSRALMRRLHPKPLTRL